MNTKTAVVECYSGHDYAERPVAFYWQAQRLEVDKITGLWRLPDGRCFRVQVADGRCFELCYDIAQDEWQVKPL